MQGSAHCRTCRQQHLDSTQLKAAGSSLQGRIAPAVLQIYASCCCNQLLQQDVC